MGREMKDSGVEWVGKIPNNWSFIKSKYIFSQKNKRGNKDNLQLLTPSQKYGVIPQTLYEELSGMVAVKLKEDTNFSLLKTIHNGDFCISLRSFQGGFEYCKYEGVVSPAYQVFSADIPVCNDYYKYLFKDKSFIEKINSYTLSLRDGKNIAFSDFGYTEIPVPPLKEQLLIANFLDKECSEIDNLTADIEKQISLLEDYKKSIITEAVTKGLNPNVEFKDSGIEWIGKIPKHWEITKIKNLGNARNGLTYSPSNLCDENSGTLVLRSSNIKNGKLSFDDNVFVNCLIKNNLKVKKGDILICSRNGSAKLIGKSALIDRDLNSSFGAFMMIFRSKLNTRYIKYILESDVFKFNLSSYLTSTINQLTNQNFSNMKIVFCNSEKEQKEIVDFLDKKCSEIDSLISDKKEQLEKLASYKQSMIYEYVTGKKEIPTQEIA